MSETEKTKPNKESTSTSTATTLAPPPPPPPPPPPSSSPLSTQTSTPATTTTTSTNISTNTGGKASTSNASTTASTNSVGSSSTTTSPPTSSSTTSSATTSTSTSTPNSTASTSTSTASSSINVNSIIKLPSKPPPPLPPPPPPPPKLLPPPAPVSRPRIHESSEPVIRKAFSEYMKDPECLDKAADYLYESLLEDAVMGVYLELHHSLKSGALEAIEGESEDDTAFKIVDTPNYEVFGMGTARKTMDCNCPNCDRPVAASRFAPHLEKCMGMGRKTSRVASRRLANAKEGSNSSYFSSNVSDDEDDADWSSEKRRKKIQTSRTNGSKKNGKSS